MIKNVQPIQIMFFYVFFCNIIQVNRFLYRFIILLHLISSFPFTRSLFVPYAYVSIASIDSILLSSYELKAILLISPVKTLCLALLNLCCVFINFYYCFYKFFMIVFKTIYVNFNFFEMAHFIFKLS